MGTTRRTGTGRWRRWRDGVAAAAVCSIVSVGVATAETPLQLAYATFPEYDRTTLREHELVVAAIEASPDIAVYRVAPATTPQTAVGAARAAGVKVAVNTGNEGIAVIYPDIGEPYRSVFSSIIEGIEDKTRARTLNVAVSSDTSPQQLLDQLRRQNIRVVIALGRHGMRLASGIDRNIGVVGGGVISAADAETRALSVLSLAPDPALLFERLKRLAPGTRRVFVVYNPEHNAWLVRLAEAAARFHELELVAREARDLKTASLHYREILATAKPRQDALWLPQDLTTVDDSSVLPLILEGAWDRSLVVFSSNVTHVRRGALFALYPNNNELGRDLAAYALEFLSTGDTSSRGVVPLKNVLLAVNVRTASHLGIQMSHQQQRDVDLVFPKR